MAKNRRYRQIKYIFYKQTAFDFEDHIWAYLGAFIGIATIGYFQSLCINKTDNIFLIGSFGASAVLLYAAKNSPMSQVRNVVGGHLISAFVGVTVAISFKSSELYWLEAALAVATSILLMQLTKTLHPPGGATALIAIIGGEKIQNLGFFYILNPVLTGVVILVLVAYIFNTISKQQHLKKALRGRNAS